MDIEKVKRLIEEPINLAGFKLDSISYEKESGNYFLRVVIDKNGIIDINDCVEVTHLINPLLDEVDSEDSYILDVCSKEKGCD